MSREPKRVTELDPSFKYEVLAHREARGLKSCFSCGTCSAGCPIHEAFPDFDPRKLAKMVSLGMRKEALSDPSLWYCAACHTCEQRCPQNVEFFGVLNVLKNMAAKAGYAPDSWAGMARQLAKTGLAVPIDRALEKKRAKLSLPPFKPRGRKARGIAGLLNLE